MKHKVVYNACHGGFSLSREAAKMLAELGDKDAQEWLSAPQEHAPGSMFDYYHPPYDLPRHDARLVKVVETLGAYEASGSFASLGIQEIEGDRYKIDDYDGFETVIEPEDIEWIYV